MVMKDKVLCEGTGDGGDLWWAQSWMQGLGLGLAAGTAPWQGVCYWITSVREAESFSGHLFPAIIYSQIMWEWSVLKIRWEPASCLLSHILFLCVFSCTCWLQQQTSPFTSICSFQEQQKPKEEWVGSTIYTATPPGSVLLLLILAGNSHSLRTGWSGCKFPAWRWFCLFTSLYRDQGRI